MNCKPGDLAVIVRGEIPSNIGKVVQVIESRMNTLGQACWLIECSGSEMEAFDVFCGKRTGRMIRTKIGICPDSELRPIRDNDREDETLTWAGKPQCVPA